MQALINFRFCPIQSPFKTKNCTIHDPNVNMGNPSASWKQNEIISMSNQGDGTFILLLFP
ncbi:hypothetical protein SLEP1_g28693 [Rubroshorea leprosula]|uniref:Uncharacterized protein n=1 Tax=Rubroshorea leprosula TaxID=152421 RepID=A0AAV5K064_9ROSI|nr:hypothetical protein SLEP1_g28693 [Rubroshorea leprosula]